MQEKTRNPPPADGLVFRTRDRTGTREGRAAVAAQMAARRRRAPVWIIWYPPARKIAVRDVVEAQGGIGELAKSTSLNREGLYDMLSEKGNPRLFSLSTVFNALGLQIAVTKKIEGTEAA